MADPAFFMRAKMVRTKTHKGLCFLGRALLFFLMFSGACRRLPQTITPDTPSPLQTIDPDTLSPLVHPPILKPIPDGVKQEIPPELGNRKLAAMGALDVTAAPFFADPSGKLDSTRAIQAAIDTARDAQMICYFPSGTYRVTDTLICRHGNHLRSHLLAVIQFNNMPCVLMGASHQDGKQTARPRILLTPQSPGFNDAAQRKYVIEYRINKITDKRNVDLNASAWSMLMRDMIVNLDIVIGEDNPGAVGVLMRSVEGAAIQDCTIDATHGLIGIEGSAANGGSWTKVTVIGGKIGLDMSGWSAPTPTMAGITLIGQETAIVSRCRGSLAVAGLSIVSRSPGPLIVQQAAGAPFDSTINIIDSSIVCENPAVVLSSPVRSVYLHNVYVSNASEIIAGVLPGKIGAWVKINDYAFGVDVDAGGNKFSAPVYLNGEKQGKVLSSVAVGERPPPDLCTQHGWGDDFPLWDNPAAVNIKAAPYNAVGDSFADDTAAVQKAIDEHDMVLIPKGYFRITKTIRLRPATKLIGVAPYISVLMVRDTDGAFGDDEDPKPMVETADAKDARCAISFIYLMVPEEIPISSKCKYLPVYALRWMSGRNSILRNVLVEPARIYGFIGSTEHRSAVFKHPQVVITGNGGGRWYNYHTSHGWKEEDASSLCMLIENTTEPLFFYNFEPQISKADRLVEVRGCRDITFLGCKTELTGTFMRVVDSKRIRILGHGGVGTGDAGKPLFVFENSDDFLITTISEQLNLNNDKPFYNGFFMRNFSVYSPLAEVRDGQKTEIPSLERPVLYLRGNPFRSTDNE